MLNAVKLWIQLSALIVASGWILSCFHQLNGTGYGIILVLAATLFFFRQRQKKTKPSQTPARFFHKIRRRGKRLIPLMFFALAALTLLAGACYAPSNGSSTAYRIPRVMHWLAEGHWHWIRTLDVRINIAGCGFEWFFAPLILLTHGDRLLFLPNWISFILLPGLIFSVFTRLKVRPRTAWWWMWLLPSGWCFIMQAGSTLNDAFGAAYALAAVDFALRARENKNFGDGCLALLAAALATGVKQTYILLALPGLIALLPCVRWLFRRPLSLSAVVALCLLISAVPMMIFDWHHTGSWSGVTTQSWQSVALASPLWGAIGNVFYLTIQNVKPPFFPFVNSWNALMHHFLQTPFGEHFRQFEDFGWLSFGVGESSASLGAGISVLILISIFAARHLRQNAVANSPESTQLFFRVLRWIPWAILLVFMTKVGNAGNGRLIASYYVLLFPSLLALPGQSVLVRRRWWQTAALLVMMLSVALVVTSRDRPLFPSQTAIGWLKAKHPDSKLVASVARTYAETPAYEEERLVFEKNLPPDAVVIGYAAISRETESLLWLPYGKRRVKSIFPEDTLEQLRSAEIKYAVISQEKFLDKTNETIQQWLARYNGILLKQWESVENPYEPPEVYYLVQLQNS